MTTTYTKINKATGTGYTKTINVAGASKYGFSLYGIGTYGGTTDYTKITKPSDGTFITAGTATGLLIPPTYAIGTNVGSAWIKINKAT